jgi:hypothetical protein
MDKVEVCRACRYWAEGDDGLGQCHKKETLVIQKISTRKSIEILPETWEYESCEDFKP